MLNKKDMTDLVYIHDAYNNLNTALLGTGLSVNFDEGILGSLSRVDCVIERNADEELKKDDYKLLWKLADDVSIPPEERGNMLVGDTDKETSTIQKEETLMENTVKKNKKEIQKKIHVGIAAMNALISIVQLCYLMHQNRKKKAIFGTENIVKGR